MGVVQRVHNDMAVASCTVLVYTLPEIVQILMSLISPLTRVTFSPLQGWNNLMHAWILKQGCVCGCVCVFHQMKFRKKFVRKMLFG